MGYQSIILPPLNDDETTVVPCEEKSNDKDAKIDENNSFIRGLNGFV